MLPPASSLRLLIVALFVVLISPDLQAKEPSREISDSVSQRQKTIARSQSSGPKVGLVLSGGGARGLAHIGVIRVLEEVGIRPDYIAGTSMGAIIGALYAMGYSAEEIGQINASAKWDKLLSNSVEDREVAIDQKDQVNNAHFIFTLNESKLRIPKGLVEGQKLWNFFYRLTYPAAEITNFDDLAIPFRCCAVNLINRKVKVFDSGSLTFAMRSSMAIPGFFTPTLVGDTALYVDGGVSENFPVQVVKKMGADIIIASYVGLSPRVTMQDLESSGEIVKQAMMFAGTSNAIREFKDCDVLIAPDIDEFGTMSFNSGKEIIERGYTSAEVKKSALEKIAARQKAPKWEHKPLNPDSYKHQVNRLFIEGVPPRVAYYVRKKLGFRLPDSISGKELERGLDRLHAMMLFSRINYELNKEGDLFLKLKMKDPLAFKVAFNANEVWRLGVIARLSLRSPLVPNSRLNVDLELSTHPRIKLDHTLYFSRRKYFMHTVTAYYGLSSIPTYFSTHRFTTFWQNRFDISTAIRFSPSKETLLSTGVQFQTIALIESVGYANWLQSSKQPVRTLNSFSLFLSLNCNTLDRRLYPKNGVKVFTYLNWDFFSRLNVDRKLSNERVRKGEHGLRGSITSAIKVDAYKSATPWLIFKLSGALGVSTMPDPLFAPFFIGGTEYTIRRVGYDFDFPGLGYRQRQEKNFLALSGGVRFSLPYNIQLGANAGYFSGDPKAMGLFTHFLKPINPIVGYDIYVGWLSRLGAMQVGLGSNTETKAVFLFVSLGISF